MLALFPPKVKVLAPKATVPPPPESAATVSAPPSDNWPLLTASVAAVLRRPAEPKVDVPLLTVIAPAPKRALIAPPCSA